MGDAGAPSPWEGSVAIRPRNALLPTCDISYFVGLGHACRDPPKNQGSWRPARLGLERR